MSLVRLGDVGHVRLSLKSRRYGRRRNGLGRLGREVLAGVDELVALEAVLLVVELPVAPAHGEQFLVRAALDYLAFFEDEDLGGAADGRKAVPDDEGRAPPPERLQAV